MADPHRQYEIRCPIHGFVAMNDWERGSFRRRHSSGCGGFASLPGPTWFTPGQCIPASSTRWA